MAKKTKELIATKFMELLKSRPLSQIGIREITDACQINRNTFYYYYKNVPDLIESVVKTSVDDILKSHPPTYETLEDGFMAAIHFAQANKRLIYNIYESTNRAIFERYLWKICDYIVSACLNSLPPIGEPPRPEEVAIIRDALKYEFFGFVIDWINHGMPDDTMGKIHLLSELLRDRVRGFDGRGPRGDR